MGADILIIDDERDIRDLVAGILSDEGYQTRVARDSNEAFAHVLQRRPALILLDIWLQGSAMDGLEILDQLQGNYADVPVIMISGHGNVETAVSAIKRGAYDYLEKPFKAERLLLLVARALEASSLKREIRELKKRAVHADELIGSSQVMNQLRLSLDKVAPTNSRVFITGAPGTGKEMVARQIHAKSPRAAGPFVVVNAAAFTAENFEREVFGEEPQAGKARRLGAFELAHGGTLLLDEVVDLPLEAQARLLRVLIEPHFTRVNGTAPVEVNVRIISTSSRDVSYEMERGRVRDDLFHRLAVVPLRVPSLKERCEDIPELVLYFIQQLSAMTGLAARRMSAEAMAVLQTHDWPGNVRQLRNNIERLMILTQADPDAVINVDMLPAEIGGKLPTMPNGTGAERVMSLPLREAREMFETEYLHAQLARFSSNISRTSEFVGMERSALHRKLKSLGLN